MKNPKPDKEVRHALENQVHRLLRTVRIQQETIIRLRREKLLLVRSVYLFPRVLYETCWSSRSWELMIGLVQEKFKEINGDPAGWRQLVQFLDRNLENAVSELSSCPKLCLNEDELRLYCYCIIGFSADLISTLMDIENRDVVYTRKRRLKMKIRRMGLLRSRRFLELMD
jgi:hypothetical protein